MQTFLQGRGRQGAAMTRALRSCCGRSPPTSGRRTEIGRFLTWLERERGLHFDGLRRAAPLVGRRPRGLLVGGLGVLRGAVRDTADERGAGPAGDAGRGVVPGRDAELRRARARRRPRTPTRSRCSRYSQTRDRVELTWGELRDQVARARAGLQRLGVGRGDRVVAYLPNIPETLVAFLATASLGAIWASCAPEFGARSVVDRFGQIEPTRAARRRRLRLRRQGHRPPRAGRRDPRGPADPARTSCTCPTAPTRCPTRSAGTSCSAEPGGARRSSRCRSPTRCACCSPPAPPASRRRSCTATAGSCSSTSRTTRLSWDLAPGRPDPVVLHHRVDDVERAGVGAAGARVDRDDRRQPAAPRPALAVAARRGDRRHADGRQPRVPHGLPSGGRASRRRSSTCRGCGRSARPAARCPPEGYRWVAEQFGPDVLLNVGSGGTDVCSGIVQGSPLQPVWVGRDLRARASASTRRRSTRRANEVVGELGELVITAPMPSMPVGFWGDADGTPLPRHLLRRLPRRLAARRLGALLRGRQRGHRRAARTPPSTAAACGWAPPSSTGSSRSCPRSPTASSCTWRTRRAATGELLLFVQLRRRGRARRRAAPPDLHRAAHRAVAAAHPRRDRRGAGGPAQPHRQEAGAAGQEDPARRRAGRRGQPRRARRPDLARPLRRARSGRGAPTS